MSTDSSVSRRFIVHGRVQGVGFRYAASRTARKLKLTGWVRNQPDGSVEIVAEGPASSIKKFETWLESGPPGARVSRVEVQPIHTSAAYSDFRVEY